MMSALDQRPTVEFDQRPMLNQDLLVWFHAGPLKEMETIDHMSLIHCAKATGFRPQQRLRGAFTNESVRLRIFFREPFTGVACWREERYDSTIRKKVPGRVSAAGPTGFTYR